MLSCKVGYMSLGNFCLSSVAMYSPKFRPPVAKQEEGSCCNLRCCLLIWAFLRMVVSLFWSGLFLFNTYKTVKKYTSGEYSPLIYTRLWFDILGILIQLVESVMIVVFIAAGIKKSYRLYRAYYCYCILTLIIYVIAVGLYSLDFSNGHYFVGVYITFLLGQLWILPFDFNTVFMFIAAVDVVLEVLLIFLIRELMKIYSFTPSETA